MPPIPLGPRVTLIWLAVVLGWPGAVLGKEPLWEAGLGVGGLSLPHYRGSDQSEVFAAPIPYAVYRGELLRYDREGLRGLFFRTDRVDLDVSADAALPINDDDNTRAGMDDLAPVLEIGPSINVRLWESAARHRYLTARLPLRAAVAINSDLGVSHQGWSFAPNLYYEDNAAGFSGAWRRTVSLGPVFSDRAYHAYYYDVPAQDAIAETRPEFRVPGGYSGARLSFASARRFGALWFGLFVRVDRLDGASFADSPLVDRRMSVTAGAGVSWVFAESQRRVPRRAR